MHAYWTSFSAASMELLYRDHRGIGREESDCPSKRLTSAFVLSHANRLVYLLVQAPRRTSVTAACRAAKEEGCLRADVSGAALERGAQAAQMAKRVLKRFVGRAA